jgi:hypothetical protein
MSETVVRDTIGRHLRDVDAVLIKRYGQPDRIAEDLSEVIDELQVSFCQYLGHSPEEDQCGKPEHDYCIWCEERTPGQASRD